MSNNLDNDRSNSGSKMYPIDLAPQKITIVKTVPNSEVKMTHLNPGQPKPAAAGQIITHTSLMRPSTQIISSNVTSQVQPHMIVSSLQGTQVVSQSSQVGGSQIITHTQIVSPATQIISQGTQLNALGNNSGVGAAVSHGQISVSSSNPVLNVGMGGLVSGAGNLVVSSTVRTLPPSVRVLPPVAHHNTRPVLSSVSLTSNIVTPGSVVVTKTINSHVPRGLAQGASLAVPRVARPITPVTNTLPISSLGTAWSTSGRGVRGAVVYSARASRPPRPAPHAPPVSAAVAPVATPHTTTSVITGGLRSLAPPRPVPLVQRNYQPAAKLLSVANVGIRPVGNSAPSQLYYEVPRSATPSQLPPGQPPPSQLPQQLAPTALTSTHLLSTQLSQPQIAPTLLTTQHTQTQHVRPVPSYHPLPNVQASVTRALTSPERRPAPAQTSQSPQPQPRPSILRKRDVEGSPTKSVPRPYSPPAWEADADGRAASGSGGSTTASATSSPEPEPEPEPAPEPAREDVSPRKKPRKQMLSSEVRQCEYPTEEKPATPPPAPVRPPPKRPQLGSSYVCGWRATALHFVRPSDVRRRDPKPRDILTIANQKHVLATAEGWKVHHLTAQMDDLVSLESDVGEQLKSVLRTLETAHGKAQAALASSSHALLELVKGNMQRSQIVCEGVQEARGDVLRVFTHRTFVSDILARQADKRCFRKHRSQS